MDSLLKDFYELEEWAKEIKRICLSMNSPLLVFHYDADGICSAAITYKALRDCGKKPRIFMTSSFHEALPFIDKENELIFLDLGSNKEVNELKDVVIIDHHQPENIKKPILNPWLKNYNASFYCSSSSLGYITFYNIAHLSLVGSIGDLQQPFHGLNKILEEEMIKRNVYKKEITFTKSKMPLKLALESSKMKVFKNNKNAADYFLEKINIDEWKSFVELKNDEKSLLVKELKNLAFYTEDQKGLNSLIKDDYVINHLNLSALEFSTALNAIGRWNKTWLAIKTCIDYEKNKENVEKQLIFHRKKLREVYKVAKKLMRIENDIVIIDGKQLIDHCIIGIVCNKFKEEFGKPVIGISNWFNKIKISLRADNINVGLTLKKLAEEFEGFGGGHINAGGCILDEKKLKPFISSLTELLSKSKKSKGNQVTIKNYIYYEDKQVKQLIRNVIT